jgi:hypothetical protein
MPRSASNTPLGFIKPELPTLVPEPPTGWIHEIKYDGYRTLIVIDRGQVRAFTRNGNDWTRAYRRVVDACMARWSSRTSTVSPIFTLSVLPSTQRRTGSCSLPSTSCTNRLERREGAETHQTPRRQPLIGATAFLMTQSAPRNE